MIKWNKKKENSLIFTELKINLYRYKDPPCKIDFLKALSG